MAGVQGDSDLLSFGVKARLGASAKSRRGTLAFVTSLTIFCQKQLLSCAIRKRGLLSETPFPLAKKPLTLAGSNHPSNADDEGEAQKPQPIDASA